MCVMLIHPIVRVCTGYYHRNLQYQLTMYGQCQVVAQRNMSIRKQIGFEGTVEQI